MKKLALVLVVIFSLFATQAMAATLKLIVNEPPGGSCKNNMFAATEAQKEYQVDVQIIGVSRAGADAKAPAVYLDDKVLAIKESERNGLITYKDLVKELGDAGVPKYQPKK